MALRDVNRECSGCRVDGCGVGCAEVRYLGVADELAEAVVVLTIQWCESRGWGRC